MILSATALQRKLASLSEHNFREYARMIVESYEHRGLLIDALLWGAILGHYEAELARAKGGAA